MTIGKGKRPRDPNQLAKWIVDRSTDETPAVEEAPANLWDTMAAMWCLFDPGAKIFSYNKRTMDRAMGPF